jgi:phytoene dehydrogenase-like protein
LSSASLGGVTAGGKYDAVVVGAGPNGLSAAIVMAKAGLATLLVEAHATPGGGARSAQLTLPGFVHDVCSTVHPLGVMSSLFRSLMLERHGLRWCDPPLALAHILDDGTAVTLERSLGATASRLGEDGPAYLDLMAPFVDDAETLLRAILGPLRPLRAPLKMARFGLLGLRSLESLAKERFTTTGARALLAGMAAHAMQPLSGSSTASFALVLALAGHVANWPVARGGSQAITNALVQELSELGGELRLGQTVTSIDELPSARAYLFDVTPRQLLSLAGHQLPERYRARLRRFRYGPSVFKMDWALRAPIPWRDPAVAHAATVHLSGSLADVAAAEAAVHQGKVAERPFVILVQPSLFDSSRAPAGQHTAWAYCHMPWGSQLDASSLIEAHVERYAPGFRDLIVARAAMDATAMERYNANYVGGDINGGSATLGQLFTRPVARLDPYSTPAPHIFLCSSSTPPGGGVHGMCGYWAAASALKRRFGRQPFMTP